MSANSYNLNEQGVERERERELGKMSEVFEGYERQYCELSANLSKKCTAAGALDGENLGPELVSERKKFIVDNFKIDFMWINQDKFEFVVDFGEILLREQKPRVFIKNLSSCIYAEQKKQKVTEIKTGIDEAESWIRKMDLEARSLQPNVKAVLLARLREYKSDLNNLKSEVKRLVFGNANAAARDELLESGMADALTASADQRSRLLMSTERINKSSDRIQESRRTMLETEELGVSILQDLSSQRQSLLHAHNTLHGVDDNIGKSKRVLTSMSRRISKNKWIIGSIIAVLVLAIILILYFKLAK
ncbi:hypothetical protein FEM48_Zijuj04G0047500 [Ziziphus jujuba var. spinosa]|uniref:t-SNARE coiled-coil homology domain-containing protein n=1 Tax=Ziziphus jujuba var. spinosa TaxID=714518 RepID=A0A978VHV8_ZIZJJ|nr:hypothetical protein FEM48_Zijuj04G0047500 [Ziziphus jujuba var. spinosa]